MDVGEWVTVQVVCSPDGGRTNESLNLYLQTVPRLEKIRSIYITT